MVYGKRQNNTDIKVQFSTLKVQNSDIYCDLNLSRVQKMGVASSRKTQNPISYLQPKILLLQIYEALLSNDQASVGGAKELWVQDLFKVHGPNTVTIWGRRLELVLTVFKASALTNLLPTTSSTRTALHGIVVDCTLHKCLHACHHNFLGSIPSREINHSLLVKP